MSGNASSLRELVRVAAARLHAAGSPSPLVDAEYLLLHVLGKTPVWLRTHDEVRLHAHDDERFEALLKRRIQGEPVAYITGLRGFWSFDLVVNAGTLIPRPETELLVEFALEKLPLDAPLRVLDLGTGSGAIALAVKAERPVCEVTAVDASAAALEVAAANADRLGLELELHSSNWFAALAGRHFDLVLANPPYIAADDVHLGQGDLRFEPLSALVSAAQGLQDIGHIIAAAPQHLLAGAWLALEHGYDQGDAVRALLEAGGFIAVATQKDLGGQDRISAGQWPGVKHDAE
ncbi:MAG: peptide chain release factor N(5)-glutamine methyltransferase [Moraxellaceae bacterium]